MAEDKSQKIEAIALEIRGCDKCPLAEGRLQAVPGSGSASSEIVFIGEGPGANEDKQGLPFVGAAGKFLDEMLRSIGLKREGVLSPMSSNAVRRRIATRSRRKSKSAQILICGVSWK